MNYHDIEADKPLPTASILQEAWARRSPTASVLPDAGQHKREGSKACPFAATSCWFFELSRRAQPEKAPLSVRIWGALF
jgi:hypothetical protein